MRRLSIGTRPVARAFNLCAILKSAGVARTIGEFGRGETVFTQGDPCKDVLYIQTGGVKLSSLSKTGQEAVVATLGPGAFFGEGCLAGQQVRRGSATAITPSVILFVRKGEMGRLLRQKHAMSDRFISHMLSRNIRVEEELIDQLFNSSEKRLASALLLMARYGQQKPDRVVPNVSQERLAQMIGASCSRVNVLLGSFKKRGFIDYDGDLPFTINRSLLNVVLHN